MFIALSKRLMFLIFSPLQSILHIHVSLTFLKYKTQCLRTSLVVQWLRICASNAGDMDSIPGLGIKILYATQCGPKNQPNKQKKQNSVSHSYCLYDKKHVA